ncbi:hypothetical protein D3C81_424790 [compost metagenome]
MSAGYKGQYVACLEQHQDMMATQRDLIELGMIMARNHAPVVIGAEDFKEQALDSLASVGRGLFSVTKWVGGKAIDGFVKGIGFAGNQLAKTFDSNDSLIKNVLGKVNKIADQEVEISAKKAAIITAKGDPDTILHDMDTLIKVLEIHDKHTKDLQSFLDKELVTLKKLKGVKKSEEIHSIIDEFDALKYPTMDLGNSMGDAHKSDVLPGGRYFVFSQKDGGTPTYSIAGDAPEGEGATHTMSKSQISEILNKLQKVNALHSRVKSSYENYLGFIKSWAEMVKGVDGNLSQLDQVSKTVVGEAEKLMAGNMGALAFYSGFTPRVVGYTDKYIHGVLGVFA